jgi:hypothetical protein
MKAVHTLFALGLAGLFLAAAMPAAGATVYNLTDKNSTISVDLTGGAGMSSWTVEGTNQLAKQWFWYRTGTTGDETSIDNLTLAASSALDTDGDTNNDFTYARYTGTGLQIELKISLTGGTTGSKTSLVSEQIRITNTGSSPLDFHFFQFCNFDLGGAADATDDQVTIIFPMVDTIVYQWDPDWEADTALLLEADYYMAGDPTTILNLFSDSSPTTLSGPASAGSGDVAWALQWDFTLGGGKSYLIGSEKLISPEPATMAMLVLGGAGLFLAKRRRG